MNKLKTIKRAQVISALRVIPAMEAGLADHVWSLEELVSLLNIKHRERAA